MGRNSLYLQRSLVMATVVTACLVGAAGEAGSQDATENARARLESARNQLDAQRKVERDLTSHIGTLAAERDQLFRQLIDAARQVQTSEGELTGIEARQAELQGQEKLLRDSLAKRHQAIAGLLAAIQRMGRNPPPVLVTRREDALTMVRSAMLLASAFPEMKDQALALADQLSELSRVMDEAKAEADRHRAQMAGLNEQRTKLAVLLEAKKKSISDRQSELDNVRRDAAEMTRNVEDLGDLIAKLDKRIVPAAQRVPAAAEPAPSQTDAGQNVALAPAAEPPLSSQGGGAAVPVPEAPKKDEPAKVAMAVPARPQPVVVIAPDGPEKAVLKSDRLTPAKPFHLLKGKLLPPARGKHVLAFGDKTQYGGQSKGMVLETRYSAQVTVPADGWVVYAGEFRSFGQLLIINAGEGYHILLAGLSQIDVQLGEFVLAGQPVGVMSAAPKAAKTKPGESAPVLYIEFRKDGRPIDPEPWWAAVSGQRGQG